MRGVWVASLLLCGLLLFSGRVRAEQYVGSARLGLGFGAQIQGSERPTVLGVSLRGDALRAARRAAWLRFGPAGELRTSEFESVEGGAGLALGAAFGAGLVTSTTLLGGAWWSNRTGAATIAEVLSLGMRDWKERPRYAAGLNLFLSFRAALASPARFEVTGGVEVDTLYLATPFVWLHDVVAARRRARAE